MKQSWWQRRWVKWIVAIVVVLILIGGFGWFRYWQNEQLTNRPITSKVTNETTRDTLKTETIKPFTQSDFLKYRQAAFDHNVDQYLNGYLVIKSASIHLPIYSRANNYTLALGVAKSYFLDAEMGKGNYVLAGHNMQQPGVLLSSLNQAHQGDDMAISNAKYTYHYRIKTKRVVDARVKLINGKAVKGSAFYLPAEDEKPLLTVYTCADGGADRLMVQGELTKKTHQ